MSDPKVPKTSDSESPTLVPQGNAKLESAPPSPDSSESQTLVDGGRGKPGASDAPTIVAGAPQARQPAASARMRQPCSTLASGAAHRHPDPPPVRSGSFPPCFRERCWADAT